jgi:hypothetical protein
MNSKMMNSRNIPIKQGQQKSLEKTMTVGKSLEFKANSKNSTAIGQPRRFDVMKSSNFLEGGVTQSQISQNATTAINNNNVS